MRISLVTYTYNDHASVEELLLQSASWGMPFAEILVVDDGSALPFPERDCLRVVRLLDNKGPGQAKRIGLAAATGDVVLSLDADMRLSPHWLRAALRHLADPTVGIVGATILPALTDTYLSRALYGISRMERREKKDAEVFFLPGAVWLFRRRMWEETGGLAGYDAPSHEDYWISRMLRERGLRLIAADSHAAYEKRRLTRLAYCRRQVRYFAPSVAAVASRQGILPALHHCETALAHALAYAARSGEAAILYIELLHVAHLLTEVARINPDLFPDGTRPAAGALAFVRDFPRLFALLRDDLALLGIPETSPSPMPFLEAFFSPLRESGFLPALEAVWADKLRAEDATADFDGHYLEKRS
ncbi:MAG: glycosyltransferase [Deltaproteobacteria bacterium]|jgi:cellulose synthase/poly-beta-1,6-N-acetylglucosamine synthase-like glycosyltransferase|nr:glycosyltransferase [Deltaproteobacteria bacterium]